MFDAGFAQRWGGPGGRLASREALTLTSEEISAAWRKFKEKYPALAPVAAKAGAADHQPVNVDLSPFEVVLADSVLTERFVRWRRKHTASNEETT